MNIAVFSDKFSGTLSALGVLEVVKDNFLDSGIFWVVNMQQIMKMFLLTTFSVDLRASIIQKAH
tara:strand:+ start:188 stop:379 length:192 start_codon:yes stop_codon:yes gene_type:complete